MVKPSLRKDAILSVAVRQVDYCDIPENLLIKSLANLFSKFFIVELKT